MQNISDMSKLIMQLLFSIYKFSRHFIYGRQWGTKEIKSINYGNPYKIISENDTDLSGLQVASKDYKPLVKHGLGHTIK